MMDSKAIAHLTSVHPRFDTRIFLKECCSLADAGFNVSLVVADGKGNEEKCNIQIYDVGSAQGRVKRILETTNRVFEKAIELDADIYHFHDPELMFIGLKLKKAGKKVIFDIHEMTREQILGKFWIPRVLRVPISKVYAYFENYACMKFDRLIVPQPAMQRYFSDLNNTDIIFNYPEAPASSQYLNERSKFNLIYSGGVSEDRGFYNVIALLGKLVLVDPRYKLYLVGAVSAEFKVYIEKMNLVDNIICTGFIPKAEVYAIYSKCAFGLILFNNVGQYYMSNALKLFEYMQNGLCVLMPNFGEWPDFNKEHSAGFNVNVQQASEISELIVGLSDSDISNIGRRNMEIAKLKFSWGSEEKKLVSIYEELVRV